MSREMLINVAEREECRVAVVENRMLEELYVERSSTQGHVGNIYLGKVTNIEPSIQAAFVDFGVEKNGFLHISDVHPRYFRGGKVLMSEDIGRRKALHHRPPVQSCLTKGQDIIVQVTKEGLKTKGPTLTTYISLPGKYLVLMPWMRHIGISQKIEDEDERKRLRELIDQLEVPKEIGFIVRTAGHGGTKRDLQADLAYLQRLWRAIEKRLEAESSPSELYQESDLIIRTLRDVFTSKISKIICDSESTARRVRDFINIAMPRFRKKVSYYDGKTPLFHKYGIEDQIRKIQSRRVELKSGGTIVIEQTEALVAIDVNSGRYRKHENAEVNACKINLEAAVEIGRQLRLRDLGGLIICDFIDMRSEAHRREVEKVFRATLREDRARSTILRMSRFGIVEMTRQRIRPSLQLSTYHECPHCSGTGQIKSHESMVIEIIRLLGLACAQEKVKRVELSVSSPVANYLQNEKRVVIAGMEQKRDKRIIINADQSYIGENHLLLCYDENNTVVEF
ncbi:MAG: Rne/Rng family ribonuclease [Planctomycetota bacterium]